MKIRYYHDAFIDSAKSLMHEYKDDTSNTLLLLGANMMARYGLNYDAETYGYDHVIIYNQEPYWGIKEWYKFDEYIDILKRADETWDYAESNIPLFGMYGIHSTHHVLKPYMDWTLYAPVDKDIDILFYGNLSQRRKNVLNFLQTKYKVKCISGEFLSSYEGVFGSTLDEYILRSKKILNIHSEEMYHEQECARMIKWIGAPCEVISEKSIQNYLGVTELEYWELYLL